MIDRQRVPTAWPTDAVIHVIAAVGVCRRAEQAVADGLVESGRLGTPSHGRLLALSSAASAGTGLSELGRLLPSPDIWWEK